jgi:hypothetical protein
LYPGARKKKNSFGQNNATARRQFIKSCKQNASDGGRPPQQRETQFELLRTVHFCMSDKKSINVRTVSEVNQCVRNPMTALLVTSTAAVQGLMLLPPAVLAILLSAAFFFLPTICDLIDDPVGLNEYESNRYEMD